MTASEAVDVGLAWRISRTFLDYLERIGDAEIHLAGGAATTTVGEFFFPFDTATPARAAFGGALRLRAHFGALEVRVASPAVEWGPQPVLTVDGAEPGSRLCLLDLQPREVVDDGPVRMWPDVAATLHADACHVFGGVYPPGQPLAPLTLRVPARVR